MQLGENLSPADLEQFDAIFLAMGAHKRKILDIPGTDLNGVMSGVDFLTKVNLNEAVNIGKEVLVIGGGDVAVDCARSAIRMGASEVHIACLESLDTMPANPSGVAEAQEEGISIQPSRTFCSIFEENGYCAGIECLKLHSMR